MDSTPAGRLVYAIAKWVAVAGGIILAAITLVTVLSVVGRALIPLGLSPIIGDYELVQAGVLFAVFCFLPWCQLTGGHAVVAVFTDRFPPRLAATFTLLGDVLMFAVAVFIGWRHWVGMLDKLGNGETTFLLRMPLWWVYASGLIGAAAFIVVAAYCVVRSAANLLSPNPTLPTSGMVE
jgi:TRAP-type C4-dicarboxylate transport system permease small subunit